MKTQTQACRLTQMMQASKHYKSYELVLPFIKVSHSVLKKIEVGDIWLLDLETFTINVVEDGLIIAELVLVSVGECYLFKLVKYLDDKVVNVKCVLGTIPKQKLEYNKNIEVRNVDLIHIDIIDKERVIANATLVNVEDKIAVKIDKVNR